jgi:hypothetical protein
MLQLQLRCRIADRGSARGSADKRRGLQQQGSCVAACGRCRKQYRAVQVAVVYHAHTGTRRLNNTGAHVIAVGCLSLPTSPFPIRPGRLTKRLGTSLWPVGLEDGPTWSFPGRRRGGRCVILRIAEAVLVDRQVPWYIAWITSGRPNTSTRSRCYGYYYFLFAKLDSVVD